MDPTLPTSPDQHAERQRRIAQVLARVTARRMAGEYIPDEAIIGEHADLMPDLAARLRILGKVEAARLRNAGGDDAPTIPHDAGSDVEQAAPIFAQMIPQYEIRRELSRGGQGVVYDAMQRSTARRVAVKVLRHGPFVEAADVARFQREVRILAQLNHPNIVTIHDSGTAAGCFYYVMDYVAGKPLDEYIVERPMNAVSSSSGAQAAQRAAPTIARAMGLARVRETMELFSKICDAVNAAHLLGIIHRDLKPRNVLVDASGEPHVLDFGLAKVATDREEATMMTSTGQFIGSLPWASPEQAEGDPSKIDLRTDVYALGVMLYQSLTGVFPYEVSGSLIEVLERIRKTEPPRFTSSHRHIDDEIETIVLKCLNKERDRRYQSAGELGRDIRLYLAGQPIEAKRDSFVYILKKQLRLHRVAVTVVVGFLFVVIAGLVSSLWFWREAVVQRDDAIFAKQEQLRLRLDAEAARTEAEENARRARLEAAISKATSAFMSEMLEAAAPRSGRRLDLTVREILDGAAQRLDEGQLADLPEVEAAARTTLGRTYLGLELIPAAEHQFERALALRRSHFGDDHVWVSHSLIDLANIQRTQNNWPAAEEMIREAIRIDRANPEGGERRIAADLHHLAALLRDQGRFLEAAALFQESLDLQLGETHIDVARSQNALALCLQELKRYDEAEQFQRDALAALRSLVNPQNPEIANYLLNLGYLRMRRGDAREAEALAREAVAIHEAALPPNHPGRAVSLSVLGTALLRLDRAAEAEGPLREVLRIRETSLPAGHWLIDQSRSALGQCLVALGRFEDAEPLLLNSFEAIEAHPAAPQERKREAIERIIELYQRWGREESAAMWRERQNKTGLDEP